jgi:UrcA family protein
MLRPIALAALITSAAYAQPAQTIPAVHYSDLDLSTEAGAATVVDRLRHAAHQTCKQPWGTPAQRRCVAETVAKSVTSLNAPLVTKLYLARR